MTTLPLSQLCHFIYFITIFSFLTPSPPLHIVLVFLRIYIMGSTGMLSHWPGVCSHRVQWFKVIWTQWRWSKCLIFATVPLQLVQDSLWHQPVYSCMFILTGPSDPETWAGQSWMEMCLCLFLMVWLVFYGLHAFCECEEKEWGVCGCLWVEVGVCFLFHFFRLSAPVRSSCYHKEHFCFTWSRKTMFFLYQHYNIWSTSFDASSYCSDKTRF